MILYREIWTQKRPIKKDPDRSWEILRKTGLCSNDYLFTLKRFPNIFRYWSQNANFFIADFAQIIGKNQI